jgi:hypothetical protein
MDPTVVAAWIAAGVSVLTLLGTLGAQYFGRRGTNKDTEKAFGEQRMQLNETLKAQSEQLERTLGEQRIRMLNERSTTAAEQLGSDKPAVRLAGVYAMAGLADDWEENRQTCVDVLCAYLQLPYEPDLGAQMFPSRAVAWGRLVRSSRCSAIAGACSSCATSSSGTAAILPAGSDPEWFGWALFVRGFAENPFTELNGNFGDLRVKLGQRIGARFLNLFSCIFNDPARIHERPFARL